MGEVSEILERVRSGDRVALSKLITMMEKDADLRKEVIGKIYGCPVKGKIICFTGPPGVGKSTLIDHVISLLVERGKKVGVILVDPRSPYTGGAILGDRIRMQRHATNPNVFIRSISCADNPEGISRSVKDILKILALAGMNYIIVETVGTGQIAVEVSYICHTTVLVLMPNMGDDIQMMKAGIIESADIYVINKCDINGADLTEAYLRDNVEPRNGWKPPIVRTIGYNRATVIPLLDKIEEHLSMENPMYVDKIRGLLRTMFLDHVDDLAIEFLNGNESFDAYVKKVAECQCDYYSAVENLYEIFKKEVLCNDKED
ncbi:LAO/AO transport system ATPase [Aciduliprofundum sp. MAR08-339]|uniref:methylmalonyl Co-A mutase-associated GTPase MeaB n=1 Tax=Aciduliprofundum sp. (strain MAR08-339) TaxID=673860 RepID=UPI0002A484F2|nr:LAO/AO transport system ATPase [Aciduliprofundum sp. MAR08-339]